MLTQAVNLTNRTSLFLASLARAQAIAGAREEARVLLGELEARGARGYIPTYEIAKWWPSARVWSGDSDR